MEKLIELLNEYGNERYDHWGDYQTDMDFTDKETYWYLSKKFGFIKRLVENDKIDLLQLDNRIALSDFNKVERVLMALSISNIPIEDLISYLK